MPTNSPYLWNDPRRYDLCCIVKRYLDRKGVQQAKFRNNMPSNEWPKSFWREMEMRCWKECMKILKDQGLLYHQIQLTIFLIISKILLKAFLPAL